jgi:hypothetical protein
VQLTGSLVSYTCTLLVGEGGGVTLWSLLTPTPLKYDSVNRCIIPILFSLSHRTSNTADSSPGVILPETLNLFPPKTFLTFLVCNYFMNHYN